MKLHEIIKLLNAEVLSVEYDADLEIEIGCSSDLMSDILAFAKPGVILLTSLTNIQVINTANMADIKAVCFVMGKSPSETVIDSARKNKIAIFKTKLTTFETCGLLYKGGLKSCSYSTFDQVKNFSF